MLKLHLFANELAFPVLFSNSVSFSRLAIILLRAFTTAPFMNKMLFPTWKQNGTNKAPKTNFHYQFLSFFLLRYQGHKNISGHDCSSAWLC